MLLNVDCAFNVQPRNIGVQCAFGNCWSVLGVSLLHQLIRYVKISCCSSCVQHMYALNAGWWFVYARGSSRGLVCFDGVNNALVMSSPQSLAIFLMAVQNCFNASCKYVLVSCVF